MVGCAPEKQPAGGVASFLFFRSQLCIRNGVVGGNEEHPNPHRQALHVNLQRFRQHCSQDGGQGIHDELQVESIASHFGDGTRKERVVGGHKIR